MRTEPLLLVYVPDRFKTLEMWERVVEDQAKALEHIPDHFKSKRMCERAIEDEPNTLELVPGHLKTQEMCEKAAEPYMQAIHAGRCARSLKDPKNV